MHMAGRRIACTFFLSSLFFMSLFVGFAQAEEADVSLSLTKNIPENGVWYTPGQPLTIESYLQHSQDNAQTIDFSDSCQGEIDVYSPSNVLVYNALFPCNNGSDQIEIEVGQHLLDRIEWDFIDNSGTILESGVYSAQIIYQELGISASTTFQFQTPTVVPAGFELHLQSVETVDEYLQNQLFFAHLHYTGDEYLDISTSPTCFFEVSYQSTIEATLPCFPARNIIMPYEILPIGMIEPSFQPTEENITLQIQTPDGQLSATATIEPVLDVQQPEWKIQFANEFEGEQSTSEPIQMELEVSHELTTNKELDFTSSCKTRLDVLNEFGEAVYSSSLIENCEAIDLSFVVGPDETESIQMPIWWVQDDQQCSIPSGEYTLLASIPEHGLFTHQQIQLRQGENLDCGSDPIEFDVMTEQVTIDRMNVHMQFIAEEDTSLRWRTPCAVEGRVYDSNDEMVHIEMMVCDDYDGRLLFIPKNAPHPLDIEFSMSMTNNALQALDNGDYALEFTTSHQFTTLTTTNVEWISDALVVDDSDDETQVVVVEPVVISGQWAAVGQENSMCWILQTDLQQFKLSGISQELSWAPQQDWSGTYNVIESQDETLACELFDATPFVLLAVFEEQPPNQFDEPQQEQQNNIVLEDEEVLPTLVTGTIAVVVSTSLLGLLFAFVLGNESLRIPTTAAGLWFIGLIGKTHETSDGKYQRGRLIGYLTANPGCHFRALMAALEMSNGQITHHIRILEAEERIWRKNDGRLVRYYPYTSHLNPATAVNDLPVPPLSPDPNSLQGKILNLLDQDGQLGDFPTQAELAKRLAKSQQLISHHLRTLQKYGLVEMRKMGIKNRYKLTREAIFLLESSPDFSD
jgi:DNA-binding MarR family transcriptional regulator